MISTLGLWFLYVVGAVVGLFIFLVVSYFAARYCGFFAFHVVGGFRAAARIALADEKKKVRARRTIEELTKKAPDDAV